MGGRQRLIGMYVSAAANLQPPPPSMLHVACPCWRCSAWYVVEAAAQPGFFSRAKSTRHESWRGCGPRVRPRWSLLGCGCASPAAIVRLCSSQATKMLDCEPVCCVFVVSRCVRDACRCVTELACRLGSGRPQVCVKRAPAQRVSLSRVGSALRPLLKSIYIYRSSCPLPPLPPLPQAAPIPLASPPLPRLCVPFPAHGACAAGTAWGVNCGPSDSPAVLNTAARTRAVAS